MKRLLKKIIPGWVFKFYHLFLAYLGAVIYRFPSKDMTVIGVTGTNGKSTTVDILHKIFSDFGIRTASFSSLRFKIPALLNEEQQGRDREIPNKMKMTMPGRLVLQKMLSLARSSGCRIVIVEVTSEGIKQYRHRGISFNAAVFTNLRPEHIEAHGSFEAYREAKSRLFGSTRRSGKTKTRSIVNLDDPSAFYFLNFPADIKYGFGILQENKKETIKNVVPTEISFKPDGTSFSWQGLSWKSPLVGDFNLYNVLCAIAVAASFQVPLESIKKSIAETKTVPGRLEVVQREPFMVVVDYAHTPDALEGVYKTVRSLWLAPGESREGQKGKLIAVLGSTGGGRDRWKRPEIGKIAESFADHIILTDEDPYDEDPKKILEEVASKMKEEKHEIVIDRAEAIKKAVGMAKKGDAVVITGKGAEPIMVVKGKKVPWDDREKVREALKTLNP